jgi:hypothetical protein
MTTVPVLARVASDEEESFDDGRTKDSLPGAVEGKSDDEVTADSRPALGHGDIPDIIATMPEVVGEEDNEDAGAPVKPESKGLDGEDTGGGVADGTSDGSAQKGTCGGSENDHEAKEVDDEVVSDIRVALGVGEEEDFEDVARSPLVTSILVSDGRTRDRADEEPLVGRPRSTVTDGTVQSGQEEDDEVPVRLRKGTDGSHLSAAPSLLADDGKLGQAGCPSGFLTQSFLCQRIVIDLTSVSAVASDFVHDAELAAGPEVENFLLGAFHSAEELLGKCLDAVVGIDQ